MGAGSIPAAPLPFQLPACALGKQWRMTPPAPVRETQKKLLASDWLSSSRCTHLGSESLDGRSSSLSLLSVYLTFQ